MGQEGASSMALKARLVGVLSSSDFVMLEQPIVPVVADSYWLKSGHDRR